jgi:hypothetical protein
MGDKKRSADVVIDWLENVFGLAFIAVAVLVPLALLVLFVRWVWRW